VAVLHHGHMVELAPTRELFLHPQHAYTRSLIASVPTLTTDRAKPLAQAIG
jgi:peptide/nickel transport system ATP-binding protein